MNLPPAILKLSIASQTGRRVRLWLPLFLLWPLALALILLGLVCTLVADVVIALLGRRAFATSLLVHSLAALGAARGTAINVSTATSAVALTVK